MVSVYIYDVVFLNCFFLELDLLYFSQEINLSFELFRFCVKVKLLYRLLRDYSDELRFNDYFGKMFYENYSYII